MEQLPYKGKIGKSLEKRLMRKDMTEVYQLTKVVGKGGLPGGESTDLMHCY